MRAKSCSNRSNTGSIKMHSLDFLSPIKYVYVELVGSWNCKKIPLSFKVKFVVHLMILEILLLNKFISSKPQQWTVVYCCSAATFCFAIRARPPDRQCTMRGTVVSEGKHFTGMVKFAGSERSNGVDSVPWEAEEKERRYDSNVREPNRKVQPNKKRRDHKYENQHRHHTKKYTMFAVSLPS